jgi:hypothetical protein
MLRRCALALLLPLLAHTQLNDVPIDSSTLPNGLDLLLYPDDKAPLAYAPTRAEARSNRLR